MKLESSHFALLVNEDMVEAAVGGGTCWGRGAGITSRACQDHAAHARRLHRHAHGVCVAETRNVHGLGKQPQGRDVLLQLQARILKVLSICLFIATRLEL